MPGALPRDPFTTADARAIGYSPRQIQTHLDAGEWIALRRGVYCTAIRRAYARTSPRLRHELDIRAAQLAVRRPSVASGWSAAMLHGLPTPITWAGQPPPVITLTATSRYGKTTAGLSLRTGPLENDQVVLMSGVRATAPARTAVDVARWSDRRELADAMAVADAVLHRGEATRPELVALLDRFARCPGIYQARQIIQRADPRAESPLESYSRLMFEQQSLPAPESQVEIYDPSGRLVARVDFLWRAMNTVGEADGRLKYAVGDVVYREKRREDMLRDLGFEVVRWTFTDVRHSPRGTADRIRAAFQRAQRRLLAS